MRFLADLALFVEAANTRNFGKAATALGMPASTLSRRISGLERELGFRLIHRSTRSFTLTEAGQACYEQSKALVAEAMRIQEDVTGLASRPSGHVRAGMAFDLAHPILIPLFARYMNEHDDVSIETVATGNHPNLLAESLDLAMMVSHQIRLPDSSFWSRRIGTFGRGLFASREYVAKRKAPQEPEDLVSHACIRFVYGGVQNHWELRRGREVKTVTVSGAATANSVGMMARLAKEGLGIVIAPDFLAMHPGFGNGLVRVMRDWEAAPANVFAVTPSEIQPARVKKLIGFLKDNFDAMTGSLQTRKRQ